LKKDFQLKSFISPLMSFFIVLLIVSSPILTWASDRSVTVLPSLVSSAPSTNSSDFVTPTISDEHLRSIVTAVIDVAAYRDVRVQFMPVTRLQPPHAVVHLHDLNHHGVEFLSINLDPHFQITSVVRNYRLSSQDFAMQAGSVEQAHCPDPSLEFIAFAPNQDQLEIQITRDVASAARASGLKTVELLVTGATRQNYFDYLSCPLLKGDFYDGDSNPYSIVTSDGVITAAELAHFDYHHQVTHIWLACQAFNDPMLGTMLETSHSQKYAAGINNLLIGPSDNAGKCAMISAIQGHPMTAAFNACYQQYDVPEDHWGFAGYGSDLFGQTRANDLP
jgi:hypothetical protein